MKLSLNYSQAAQNLYQGKQIAFDVWKCPAWPDLVSAIQSEKAVYVHFGMDAGHPDFAHTDWNECERLLEQTQTPYINVHLNAVREHFDGETQAVLYRQVRDRFLANVGFMVERFGAERVIAENVIYRGEEGKFLRASVEPEMIRDIVHETGCGLLLDTAHATMTCKHLQTSVEDYLNALPVWALREWHVTGIQADNTERLRDSMPMTPDDWRTTEYVLGQIAQGAWPHPWAIAWEYGGVGSGYEWRSDAVVIAEQFPRLVDLVQSAGLLVV